MSWERFRQKKHHRYKAISKSIKKRHCPRGKSGKDANDRMAEQIYPTALEKVFRSDLQIHDPSLASEGIYAGAAAVAFTGYQFLCENTKALFLPKK
jgi:hypothetical protein